MADLLLDATTRHQIWLQRYASYQANSFDPALIEADKIIRDVLGREEELTTKKQLNDVNREIDERLTELYSNWADELSSGFQDLAESESEFTVGLLEKATEGVSVLLPSAASVLSAILFVPVQLNDDGQSALLKPWLDGFTPRQVGLTKDAIRKGFANGETNQQIIKKLRGTKANNYKDGILTKTTYRGASSIARTGVNHVANQAKMQVWLKNKDILRGWVFVATLDNRTTNICRFNDQREFKLGKGPLPPLHVLCRSTGAPKVKDKHSILSKKQQTTRASVGSTGGKQTKKSPYYTWLETQPNYFQDEVLGKTKGQLFRRGGLSAEEFKRLTSNNLGEPLTLAQVKAKNPQAWERAGLDTD